MLLYLCAFALTTAFIYQAQRASRQKASFWYCLAVLALSTLAGMRSYSIGTDTSGYISYGYTLAVQNMGHFSSYVSSMPSTEISLLLLEYFSAWIGAERHLVLFIFSLVTCSFFCAGIIHQRRIQPDLQWLDWLFFCLFYFNLSLNMMRQSAAIAILYDAFSYTPRSRAADGTQESLWKYALRSSILILFAMTWHRTAALGFLFLLFRLLIVQRHRSIWTTVFVFLNALAPVVIKPAVTLLYSLHIIPKRYSEYLDSSSAAHPDRAQITLGIILLCLIIIYVFAKETLPSCIDPFFFCLLIGYTSSNIMATMELIRRYAFYYSIALMHIVPSSALLFRKEDGSRKWACRGICIMMFVYWYMVFVFAGWNQTIPYQLGI